jgi:hypothetical protein
MVKSTKFNKKNSQLKYKKTILNMEATEKSCETSDFGLKNKANHANIVPDEGFEKNVLYSMFYMTENNKTSDPSTINKRNNPENFPEGGFTHDANLSLKSDQSKHHGNDMVMKNKKKKDYNNIVEKTDEKISGYREIVKNLTNIIYDKNRKIKKDKKSNTLFVERFKTVQPEFKISSLTTFGKHNPEILEEIEMKEIIITKLDGIIKLIQHIYFNDRRPQYQNVRMRNIQEKLCEFYDGTIWKTIEESTIIHNIIVYTKDIIDNYYDKNKRKFSKYYQEKYRNFSNLFDEIIINKMNENIKNEKYEKIYNKIKILLINKKKIDRVIKEKNKLSITV